MSMGAIFALVLLAAFFHAAWNAGVKHATDRGMVLGLVSLAHVVLGGIMALFLPFPPLEAWPYIVASTIIHFGYYILLFQSYRHGELQPCLSDRPRIGADTRDTGRAGLCW